MVIHHRLIGLALTGWLLGSVAGVQAAGPWYVSTNGLDSGHSGLDWSQAFASISNALTNASLSDTIWVSNGVYTLTAAINNGSTRKCKIRAMSTNARDTVLLGPGSNDLVNFRGVYMNGAGSLLQGFTVTNFYLLDGGGAGIFCELGGFISNCIVAGNINVSKSTGGGILIYTAGGIAENCDIIGNRTGGNGGGVYIVQQDTARVKNCRIVGNISTGGAGGGVSFQLSGTYAYSCGILQDCVVASNTALFGGGIDAGSGAIVSNCQVFANTASGLDNGVGGLVVNGSAAPTKTNIITDCVFSNNYGAYGGGIKDYVYNGTTRTTGDVRIIRCIFNNNRTGAGRAAAISLELTNGSTYQIRNCLVVNHTTTGTVSGKIGAAVYIIAPTGLIENCTIAGNTLTCPAALVAGLYVTNGVRVLNSIIYHNLNTGGGQSNVIASADCTFSNSCTAPLSAVAGTANTEADPQFVAMETGNFRLAGNSPCINTGMYQAWMTNAVDLDGHARIRDGTVDMGAYECIYEGAIFMFH